MNKLFLVVLLFAVLQATYCSPAKRNWDNELEEEYSTVSTTEYDQPIEEYNPLDKEEEDQMPLEESNKDEGEMNLDAYYVDTEIKEEESPQYEMRRQDIVEGDIKLTPVQAAIFKESGWDGLVKSEAWMRNHGVWPRVIPYTISGIRMQEINALMKSIAMLQQYTCLRFVRRTNQRDYLHFINNGGCWSYIGRTGGVQRISLGPGCGAAVPVHEIMHALGRFHEQSRPDRDTYVRILYENIIKGMERNFNKHFTSDSQSVPYDYGSLMHYGKYDFSKNGRPTIETQQPPNAAIGQRNRLSGYDIMQINIRYCPERMVRLVNGRSQNEGRVEVNWRGQWGTVCDDYFDILDGNVICKYLGYSKASRVFNRGAHFGQGSGPIWFDDMTCSGHERSPFHCPKKTPAGSHNCHHREDAGVVCQIPGVKQEDAVRLVNGTRHAGRVEVYFEGYGWGTVCDDYFGPQEARVICRQLGYRDVTSVQYYRSAQYGEGTLPILLDNLNCTGNESDMRRCQANRVGSHNCGHHEDVSVKCM